MKIRKQIMIEPTLVKAVGKYIASHKPAVQSFSHAVEIALTRYIKNEIKHTGGDMNTDKLIFLHSLVTDSYEQYDTIAQAEQAQSVSETEFEYKDKTEIVFLTADEAKERGIDFEIK